MSSPGASSGCNSGGWPRATTTPSSILATCGRLQQPAVRIFFSTCQPLLVVVKHCFLSISRLLAVTDLVDLSLQVVDDLGRHLVTQDLEQVDPLVHGDGLVRRQLDTFLDLVTK